MRNEVIAPINHGVLSTASTTAVEAGKSGLAGLLKGAGLGFLGSIAVGALVVGGVGLAAGLLMAPVLGATTILSGLTLGAGIGSVVGLVAAPFGGIQLGAGLGTLIGGFKGASRGLERVGQERGAANMLSAQVDAYKAQNQPQTVVYAPSASNHQSFPAQGSPMNQAGSTVTNAQYMDRVNGAELAAARA